MSVKSDVANLFVNRPKTWIGTDEVRELGGESATRMLRELRAEGWSIKTRRGETGFQYQLTRPPAKAKVAKYV